MRQSLTDKKNPNLTDKDMKKGKTKKILEELLFPIAAVAAVLAVWCIAAAVTGNKLILPTPKQAAVELIRYFTLAEFYLSLAATVARSLVAFALAALMSALTASVAQICRPLKLFLRTLVGILRSIPTISIILLLIIWTNSTLTPILVALVVVYPTLFASITAALEGIDPALEETAKIYAVSLPKKLIKIYAPLVAPNFLENAASAISLNLKLVIAAEVLSQTVGSIGLMMQLSQMYFETGRLLALTVAVVAVAAILEGLVRLIKRATCSWV